MGLLLRTPIGLPRYSDLFSHIVEVSRTEDTQMGCSPFPNNRLTYANAHRNASASTEHHRSTKAQPRMPPPLRRFPAKRLQRETVLGPNSALFQKLSKKGRIPPLRDRAASTQGAATSFSQPP